MKSNLLNRWIINSTIVFAVFFIILVIITFNQTFDYAKGNSYAAKHIVGELLHNLLISLGFSFVGTMTFGQIVFWVAELLRKLNILRFNELGIGQYIVIPIITLIFTVIVALLTLPLWLRIPF
ncbi:MAG: hypothetical protein J6X48_02235 [Lachnospiraceae bacterium]|nr:hypothetical protein [Lachnospiraceae bacterium]